MRSAYRFFLHTLALLILYVLVNLIAGLKFLPGDVTQELAAVQSGQYVCGCSARPRGGRWAARRRDLRGARARSA